MSLRNTVIAIAASSLLACDEERRRADEKPKDPTASAPALTAALSAKPAPRTRPEKDPEAKRRPKSILLAEARELVGWRVADGFLDRKDIVELAMQSADGRESLRSEIEALVDDELAAHRRREADWRFPTAPDRLSRAFTTLDKQGVIARERFTDCRKCGVGEMKALREDLLEQGKRADGYVFFTDQDADGVSQSGELVLEFGSFREDAEADRKIGERVAQVLRAEGLEAVLETDDDEAYLVLTGLEWQRRRFTRAPR
jgi:hypothetical protein